MTIYRIKTNKNKHKLNNSKYKLNNIKYRSYCPYCKYGKMYGNSNKCCKECGSFLMTICYYSIE